MLWKLKFVKKLKCKISLKTQEFLLLRKCVSYTILFLFQKQGNYEHDKILWYLNMKMNVSMIWQLAFRNGKKFLMTLMTRKKLCLFIFVIVLIIKNIIVTDIYDWDENTSLNLNVYIRPEEKLTDIIVPKLPKIS